MPRRLPRALRAGDEVAVLAPASGVQDAAALQRGLARWRAWGFVPTLLPHAGGRLDWPAGCPLAASDAHRLADLQQALCDARFRAIVAVRGGYGTLRLLEHLDLAPLAADPKPIVGYSDLTALLAAAHAVAGVGGLHGPMMATTEAMDAGADGWELQRRLLMGTAPAELPQGAGRGVVAGMAEGPLVGGNLTIVDALVGTRWQVVTDSALLFFEDIGEAPYRIDRMLTHLHLAGAFARVAGVVLGDFHAAGTPYASEDAATVAVLEERLGRLGVPVARGFPFGHRPGSWTLPYGGRARLAVPAPGAPATLQLLEPAVVA